MQIIGRKQLGYSDLHLDATYQGGRNGNAGDDPLPSLLSVSNQGGFRYLGKKEEPRLIVLTTSLTDPNWPDEVDLENGVFTYYGDNKTPGRELHDTPRFGNKLLAMVFDAFHSERRERVPPFLIFSGAGVYRDMAFRGLAVPGVAGLSQYEDLIAVWKVSDGHRFQNYRAKFSILDVACVSRQWLKDIQNNLDILRNAPREWIEWVLTSKANILRATRTIEIRKSRGANAFKPCGSKHAVHSSETFF